MSKTFFLVFAFLYGCLLLYAFFINASAPTITVLFTVNVAAYSIIKRMEELHGTT